MTDVVEQLLELLELRKLDDYLYQGTSEDLGFPNVFGGQVVGQALMAAYRTVDSELSAHSLHAYFLRAGDPAHDIIYEVTQLRDGRSFSARRVVARQHNQEILTLTASFQREEAGFEHQFDMPDVVAPDGLKSELQMRRENAQCIPESKRAQLTRESPIEIRPTWPMNYVKPEPRPPYKDTWFRAISSLPDEQYWHHCLLAYASDFGLLGTGLLPHGKSFYQRDMQVASLDHAVWFQRSFRFDDWLLYSTDSPSASGSRCFNRGTVFDRQGRLVATTAQDGLIRYRPQKS
ncbi:acyl-CoA thioesterase [Allohahella sp. A8]|mgnify:CR=1 FL=1|uniref:acyl-CoA thioesterase n=1 Tax=Allohahella sp. A8 TaxID=3141461 RepID=UPI000C091CEF|nr:acyl-CoA thioesterase II [Hahellaceae bacterium]|tara:strand:- start:69521 stop:70390 length:870 start_codon:yes stop_codon:yes gene_type:complete